MTLYEIAKKIAARLSNIFLRDENGRGPVYGDTKKFQKDPHWRDYILFYECFHGDNGAGLGASHQTGWTGLIARAMDLFARLTPERALERPSDAAGIMTRSQVTGESVAPDRQLSTCTPSRFANDGVCCDEACMPGDRKAWDLEVSNRLKST